MPRIDGTMSSYLSRATLKYATVSLGIGLLASCAGGLGKDECRAADWHLIGYEDGLHGYPADRIGAHRVACAKHQITPDLAAYMEGRERGLTTYCQPSNGFRVGLNGRPYANVCSAATGPAFVDGLKYGRQIHDARAELRDAQNRLRNARDGLLQTEAALQSAGAELVQPEVPTTRRVFLAQELVRLAEERAELQARIDRLTLRSRELAANVMQLERQSPYVL